MALGPPPLRAESSCAETCRAEDSSVAACRVGTSFVDLCCAAACPFRSSGRTSEVISCSAQYRLSISSAGIPRLRQQSVSLHPHTSNCPRTNRQWAASSGQHDLSTKPRTRICPACAITISRACLRAYSKGRIGEAKYKHPYRGHVHQWIRRGTLALHRYWRVSRASVCCAA